MTREPATIEYIDGEGWCWADAATIAEYRGDQPQDGQEHGWNGPFATQAEAVADAIAHGEQVALHSQTSTPEADMQYPDLDADGPSVYRAGVRYAIEGQPALAFPGGHLSFAAAAEKARKLCAALRAAGEVGVSPHVGVSGERPAGFPRNGVTL